VLGSKQAVGLAALLAISLGCEPPETIMAPRYRFVDAELRSTPPRWTSRGTIENDTRRVLRHFAVGKIVSKRNFEVPADGHISLRPRLPDMFRDSSRVALEGALWNARTSHELPPSVVRVETRGSRRFLAIEFDVDPAVPRGVPLNLLVRGTGPRDEERDIYETPAVTVPEGARLSFGIGVLEPGWAQGPVEFSVEACRPERCDPLFAETLDPGQEDQQGWQDHEVSLADLAGQEASFRFEARHLRQEPEAFSFPLWSNPTIYAPEPRGRRDQNIILLSMDTLRADHLPSYGYARDTAPFVEQKLAQGGTLFETAISAASTTAPSHMTMFTSLQPAVHGVLSNTGIRPLRRTTPTLAEILRSNHFATGAVTENAALWRNRGFQRGFNSYVESRDASTAERHTSGGIEETLDRGLAWLRRHRDKRFFAFLHTYEVHSPYDPPQAYKKLFQDEPKRPAGDPNAPLRMWAALRYDREIRYSDDVLREFIETLEAEGLLRNTLLIYTSDHGEEFLEHGFLRHGADIHEEILRVPLIFLGPGIPAGRRISAPVGLVDLMPTILELAGIAPVEGLMGKSFAAMLSGEPPDRSWESRPIYSEARQPIAMVVQNGKRSYVKVKVPAFSVRVGSRKLIRRPAEEGFRYRYYDLERDPREKQNRYSESDPSVADLRELLDRYEEVTDSLNAELDQLERAHIEGLPDGVDPDGPVLDPQREERLRALGYLY
jgi:arylsulfatase A-like enzyme